MDSVYVAYLLAFVLATAACLGAAFRARSVSNPETRRALTWFFLGSAAWAGTYVGFLLVGAAFGKHLFYQGSLIVGYGTVFAWLWFCSAYSGRSLHRNRKVQVFAAVLYVVVTALKVTNPWHGLYYGLAPTSGAFGLVVIHETLYWVSMAVAYALAAAGYLMIYELFLRAEASVTPLAVLTGLTALPAALNVIGHVNPALLDITHEPLGVAVFAVGLLFTYETQFSVVGLTGNVEDPNLTVGPDGKIRGLGGRIADVVPPLSREDLGAPLARTLPGLSRVLEAGESVWEACFEGASSEDGEKRYYQVVSTDLRKSKETQTVILSDITERKRRARRLKEAKEDAERARQEAEEASRMRSAMLANMSHEIRTPLTSIIGFAEALNEESHRWEGPVGDFAQLIEDSGRRLLDTLDGVLNLSKLEAGEMALSPKPVDLAEEARAVAKQLRPKAEEKGLHLEAPAGEASVRARADDGGVQIVLQNLISNAIKYTEDGEVRVRTYRTEGKAILEVEDTGIGMDPEMAEDLFEPFRQASEGFGREYEGTGIGLAVTRRATEEMDATIDLETEKGEGSRFIVRFPKFKEDTAESARSSPVRT